MVGVGLVVGRKVSLSQHSKPKERVDLKPKRAKSGHVADKKVVFLDYAGRVFGGFQPRLSFISRGH